MLIEIIPDNLRQGGLTRSRLTDDNGIHAQAHLHNVLTGMEIGIGIDNSLELFLYIIKTYQLVENVLGDQGFTTPLTELRYRTVFFMTMLTNHNYSTSFCICLTTADGFSFQLSRFGLFTFNRLRLNNTNSINIIPTSADHKI